MAIRAVHQDALAAIVTSHTSLPAMLQGERAARIVCAPRHVCRHGRRWRTPETGRDDSRHESLVYRSGTAVMRAWSIAQAACLSASVALSALLVTRRAVDSNAHGFGAADPS